MKRLNAILLGYEDEWLINDYLRSWTGGCKKRARVLQVLYHSMVRQTRQERKMAKEMAGYFSWKSSGGGKRGQGYHKGKGLIPLLIRASRRRLLSLPAPDRNPAQKKRGLEPKRRSP